MKFVQGKILAAAMLASCAIMPLGMTSALAHPPSAGHSSEAEKAALEADRADILAMAGDYKVTFDMQESTPWIKDYEPLKEKISHAHESVRVIEDSGTKIVLQHLLVVKTDEGKSFIVKHWRQDWQYEPESLLVYQGESRWELEPVNEQRRHGRWSQTVYQVDDSPRYAGIGAWETQGGVRRWNSDWTLRPLARRDAVRHPIYDRYYSINRHSPTPTGWIHFQDNTKLMKDGDQLKPVVQEYVLNTYDRDSNYDVAAADKYWESTKDYWAAVRSDWDKLLQRTGKIQVTEQEGGTVVSDRLLEMATDIADGKMASADAVAEAGKLIGNDNTRMAMAQRPKK